MKKTYIAPAIKVRKVETESLLAASDGFTEQNGKWTQSWDDEEPDPIDNSNSILGKRNVFSGNWYDDNNE